MAFGYLIIVVIPSLGDIYWISMVNLWYYLEHDSCHVEIIHFFHVVRISQSTKHDFKRIFMKEESYSLTQLSIHYCYLAHGLMAAFKQTQLLWWSCVTFASSHRCLPALWARQLIQQRGKEKRCCLLCGTPKLQPKIDHNIKLFNKIGTSQ